MKTSVCVAFLVLAMFTTAGIAGPEAPTPVPGATAPAHAIDILSILFLCGVMGLVGQGCRVIVGFATIATSKAVAPEENRDVLNLARLVFSLIVGFLVGVVTALSIWGQSGLAGIHVDTFADMMKFAIAGYIGTDAIEAFTVQYFEKRKQASSAEQEPP